jgi:hypothetical protein
MSRERKLIQIFWASRRAVSRRAVGLSAPAPSHMRRTAVRLYVLRRVRYYPSRERTVRTIGATWCASALLVNLTPPIFLGQLSFFFALCACIHTRMCIRVYAHASLARA